MLASLRKHSAPIVAALVASAMTAGLPAIAAQVINADKLNGRHGVGCRVDAAARENVYVATCTRGRREKKLPLWAIGTVTNSAKLAGRTPQDFDDAQTLDGSDSSSFYAAGAKVDDSDRLDGRDSSDFDDALTLQGKSASDFYAAGSKVADSARADVAAVAQRVACDGCVEPWHNVGAAGEPAFQVGGCFDFANSKYGTPSNAGFGFNPAGYYKDPFGLVHLRGTIRCPEGYSWGGAAVFTLPPGYRTTQQERHPAVLLGGTPGWYVALEPDGSVSGGSGGNGLLSLEGVTFRAAG